jgi:opacity protein-like surface antigen
MSLPRVEIPIWPGKALTMGGHEDWSFPDWDMRLELAYLGAQEHDLRTRTGPPGGLGTTYFTTSETHSLMATTRLDVPIQAPLNALFGRLPILDPLTLYGGGGIGVSFTDLRTVARDDRAEEQAINFAYQFGAGLGYAMSDALHLSLGWRYVNFGVTRADLINRLGDRIGSIESDIGAHEFTVSARYSFWSVPLFEKRD